MTTIKQIKTHSYNMLEIFVILAPEQPGMITLTPLTNVNQPKQQVVVNNGYFRWLKIPLLPDTTYQIEWSCLDISIAYLSGCPDIFEAGVQFLVMNKDEVLQLENKDLHKYFDQPYREQYHFTPFKNWMNDPNGLCWFQGYYHLFYQANPFEQRWGNIYWGHAVSKDMIHWTHLPYVLEPQQTLWNDKTLVGGAFSGSAVVNDNEVVLFFTRSEESLDGSIVSQQQYVCRTTDMLSFSAEELIISQEPEGSAKDFRDPKVFFMNGCWYMVLGGGYEGKAAILLYQSQDLIHWEFLHPLLSEDDQSIRAIECPDCFELDGKYVVLAAWMKHTDEYGRYQMTRYYIGHFEETHYVIEHQGWFDCGSNLYAVQTFQKDNDRIAIGWVSDFYNELQPVADGAYGSFCIPRKLWIEHSSLYMETFPYVSSLKMKMIYQGTASLLHQDNLEDTCYHLMINFSKPSDFDILLGRDGNKEIHLICSQGKTELKTVGVNSENIKFVFNCRKVKHLDVYADRRLIEVFINKGEAAGAKLFYNSNKSGCLSVETYDKESAPAIELYSMKSIW